MGVEYRAVQWNRQKRLYDFTLGGGVAAFISTFIVVTKLRFPLITDEILLMRAFGVAALVLLHVILCIGPLCRLHREFLPLLYNRRHLGVTMALLSLIHAVLVVATYHAGGDVNPILSIFISDPVRGSPLGIPFQPLGFVALVILLLMAATSHDFWLANLTAPVWKALHMLVYFAYGLLVLHVTLGVLQAETSPLYVAATAAGVVTLLGLHVVAGLKERKLDRPLEEPIVTKQTMHSFPSPQPSPLGRGSMASSGGGSRVALDFDERGECGSLSPGERVGVRGNAPHKPSAPPGTLDNFIDICAVADIPEKRARLVCLSGERVAIFKYDGKISAVSNVCQHQNGPLGEGRVIDGCITCPWHGYQYLPETGASPPPFVEKVPTFNVRVVNGRVLVHPKPNPAGTRVEPARIDAPECDQSLATSTAT